MILGIYYFYFEKITAKALRNDESLCHSREGGMTLYKSVWIFICDTLRPLQHCGKTNTSKALSV